MASFKRKVAQAQLSTQSSSPRKRFKVHSDNQELMLLGQVPIMSLPVVFKRIPDCGLVNSVRQIIDSGNRTQKQIAKECYISQTKMSQFMNDGTRTKGWSTMERKITDWLQRFTNEVPGRDLSCPSENKSEQHEEPDSNCIFTISRVQNCYNPTMRIQPHSFAIGESTKNQDQKDDCEHYPFSDVVSLDYGQVESCNGCSVNDMQLEVHLQGEDLSLWWEFPI